MDVSRLHRVLKIITLLQGRRQLRPDDLARELEVSKRTIYRDMNMLELAGIPFYFDHDHGGYCIHQTFWLPPINLNIEEALSLIALARQTAHDEGVPMMTPAIDAARKIESQLPLSIRSAVGHLSEGISIRRGRIARHEHLAPVYETLRKALAGRRPVSIRYISFHDRKQLPITLEPYWLVFHDRAWYVIGHSREHGEVRTLKLGRIAQAETLADQQFDPPKMTLEDHLGLAWRFIRGKQRYDISLRFEPLVAANVAEVQWHSTQKVQWQDDGRIVYDVTVEGLDEIVWWILGYGDQVEVLHPPELRQRIRQTAAKMASRHKDPVRKSEHLEATAKTCAVRAKGRALKSQSRGRK